MDSNGKRDRKQFGSFQIFNFEIDLLEKALKGAPVNDDFRVNH